MSLFEATLQGARTGLARRLQVALRRLLRARVGGLDKVLEVVHARAALDAEALLRAGALRVVVNVGVDVLARLKF